MFASSRFAVSILLLVGVAQAQRVLVVDDDGGAGVFTDLQVAIDFASPFDTILVKAGSYGGASLLSLTKPLTLVADRGQRVDLTAPLQVHGVAFGSVLIHGLFVQPRRRAGPSLSIRGCSVPVWVEDCELRGPLVYSVTSLGVAVSVDSSSPVTLMRCRIEGGNSGANPVAGAPALVVDRSVLYAMDTNIRGGSASGTGFAGPHHGGSGVDATDSTVYLQTTQTLGGDGGPAAVNGSGQCVPGGAGGAGLTLAGANAELLRSNSVIASGFGGPPVGACPGGAAGPSLTVLSGVVTEIVGSSRTLTVDGPIRELEATTLTVLGPAGDAVWVNLAAAQRPVLLRFVGAPLLLSPSPMVSLPLGVLPSSGKLDVSVTGPRLPPLIQAVTVYAQVFALSPTEGLSGGSAQALTVLASVL